jgi:hypothetical protein
MVFQFVHPEAPTPIPPGFARCPDGLLAIDDQTLTSVIKVEPFDNTDSKSVESVHKTHLWANPIHGWVPLARFKEWAHEAKLREMPEPSPEGSVTTRAEEEGGSK